MPTPYPTPSCGRQAHRASFQAATEGLGKVPGIGPSATLVYDRNAVTAAFVCGEDGLGHQQKRQLRRSGFGVRRACAGGTLWLRRVTTETAAVA